MCVVDIRKTIPRGQIDVVPATITSSALPYDAWQKEGTGRSDAMITYGQFKELYDAIGGEPEFPLCFEGRPDDEYMIIKYDDGPTFQKCFDGGYLGDREKKFASLNALYHATMPDGICLEKDWGVSKP